VAGTPRALSRGMESIFDFVEFFWQLVNIVWST
jgi:hypothetical protein